MADKVKNLDLPKEGFARLPQVKHATGHSRSTIYALMAKDEFCKSVKVGSSTFWRVEDVRAYISRVGAQASNDPMYDVKVEK